MSSSSSSILPVKAWSTRAKQHHEKIAPFADAFIKRRACGLKHPVHDFLFTYYQCSPLKLKQWVPSYQEKLTITPAIHDEYPWFRDYWFHLEGEILSLNIEKIPKNTKGIARFIESICKEIEKRPPRFGCFGLHEWAMVYKLPIEEIRHQGYQLRLSSQELNDFVESQSLCCTHYDAFRFFTKEAQPLNQLTPSLDSRIEMEQGGCVHANMDIYKWATKLWPWIGSDFIAKAFMLALEGRELDMRASPYDLSKEGYRPICIETPEGRKEYQREQQQYAEKSALLRQELHAFCLQFLGNQDVSACTPSV